MRYESEGWRLGVDVGEGLPLAGPLMQDTAAAFSKELKMTSELTIRQMQAQVDEWVSQWEVGYFPPLLNLARLLEESGELARVLAHREGKTPKAGEAKGELEEELADVLFCLICLANQHGISLDHGFQACMHKLRTRDAQRFPARR